MKSAENVLVRELRAVLDDVDRAMAERPAPMPPWEQIQAFGRRARLLRRRRLTAVVTVTAVAVAVLLLVQNSMFPAIDRGAPAQYHGEIRGSLASDQAWLADLREWATTRNLTDRQKVESGKKSKDRAKNVQVVYASDIGDHRMAVIRGDWQGMDGVKSGNVFDSVQVWGKKGAAPEELSLMPLFWTGQFGGGADPKGWIHVVPGDPARGAGAVAYVVSDADQEVILQQPPTVAADGTVTQHSRRIQGDRGVYEVAVNSPGHYAVVVPGQTYKDFFVEKPAVDRSLIDGTPDRGGQALPKQTVAGLAEDTWLTSRQPFTEGNWKLLASEPGAVDADTPHRAAAGVLELPSGARVLAVGHISAPSGKVHTGLDTAALLPAGDNGGLSYAWQVTTDPTDESAEQGVTAVAALGPEGTATVEWRGPKGTTTSAAQDSLARTDRTDVESVTFRNAAGEEIGTRKVAVGTVPRFSGSYDGKPITFYEDRPFWLLPEIREGLAGY